MPNKNGKTPAAPVVPVNMGSFRQQLKDPERAGEISIGEAAEMRERKRLIEKAQTEFTAAQNDLSDRSKILSLLNSEYVTFLKNTIGAHGINTDDDYNVSSDTGVIWRTAVLLHPEADAPEPTDLPELEVLPDSTE